MHAALQGVRTKIGLLEFRIMCSSGTTCLHADCCCSEQALTNIQQSILVYSTKRISPSSDQM